MFRREYEVLSTMKTVNSRHLVKRLAAYKGGNSNIVGAFLFPWATSDLTGFWHKNSADHDTPQMYKWIFAQIKGLAEALSLLDRAFETFKKNVRHGDLKPDNILWFSGPSKDDLGYLAIADVGLAKVHAEITKKRNGPTSTLFASEPYAAPEMTFNPFKKPTSRKYDMWSMGCICIEAIIWLMYGQSELQRFTFGPSQASGNATRIVERFYTYDKLPITLTAKLDGRVNNWMEHIRKDELCGDHTAIQELLNFVRDRLLMPDPERRCSSEEFAGKMSEICNGLENQGLRINSNGDSTPGTGPPDRGSGGLLRTLVLINRPSRSSTAPQTEVGFSPRK